MTTIPYLYKWRNEIASIHSNWGAQRLILANREDIPASIWELRDNILQQVPETNEAAQRYTATQFGTAGNFDEAYFTEVMQRGAGDADYNAIQDRLRNLSLAIDAKIDVLDVNKKKERYL